MGGIIKKRMKYLLSTAMRVGSTWVGRIISQINCANNPDVDQDYLFLGKKIDGVEKLIKPVNFLYINNIINNSNNSYVKSHRITPSYMALLTEINPKVKCVNVTRNKKDAVLSRYHYARHHCGESDVISAMEGTDIQDDLESIIYLFESTDIIKGWCREIDLFNIEINSESFLTLSYEKLNEGDPHEFKRLCEFVKGGSMEEKNINAIIKRNSFTNIQKNEKEKFADRGGNSLFARKGLIGEGQKLLKDLDI